MFTGKLGGTQVFGSVQLRMARGALGWSIRDLADKAQVHHNTISRIERGGETSRGTLLILQKTLEEAGVRFTDDGCVCPPRATGEAMEA